MSALDGSPLALLAGPVADGAAGRGVRAVTGHTRGPWAVNQMFGAYESPDGDNDLPGATVDIPTIGFAGGTHVSAIEVWGQNANANARLIAAAPQMLDALEVVRMSRGWHDMSEQLQTLIADAIAKATGGAA